MQNTSIQISDIERFKQKLQDSLRKEASTYQTIKIAKDNNVYVLGDKDNLVYFIEKGQVKLQALSPDGKECILTIHSLGDIFGELSISGSKERMETAVAMTSVQLKPIPFSKFLQHLTKESLLEDFVKYLTVRVAEQQQVIANLVTVDSEHRLGKTLLQLAQSIGKKYSYGTRIIGLKISHEELSEMIGTTRPRISLFMQRFRNLGLLMITKERYIIIEEQKLANYLENLD